MTWDVAIVVLWCLVIVQGVALIAVYRYVGRMYLSGPPSEHAGLDRDPQGFVAIDVRGSSIRVPAKGRSTIALYVSSTCPPCEALRGDLARAGGLEVAAETFLVIVHNGAADEAKSWLTVGHTVVHDADESILSHLGVTATPYVVGWDSLGELQMARVGPTSDFLRRALSPT